MAINLRCKACKSESKLGTRTCKKCKSELTGSNKKYRVVVKLPNGRRKCKQVDNLDFARTLEIKYRTSAVEDEEIQAPVQG